MKTFLAIYLGDPAAKEAAETSVDGHREKEGMQAWIKWGERNAAAIVENGPPLGKTKRIDKQGIRDVVNELTAYAVVQAETHEEAAKLFLMHPHFAIFPGKGVEVMECLPMPEMPT